MEWDSRHREREGDIVDRWDNRTWNGRQQRKRDKEDEERERGLE